MTGSPDGSEVKNPLASEGDTGDVSLIPRLGRFPGEGNGNPLQYSCLGNPRDRAWQTTVHGGHKRVRHDFTSDNSQGWQETQRLSLQCHWVATPALECSVGFLFIKATQALTCLSYWKLGFLFLGAEYIPYWYAWYYANSPSPPPFFLPGKRIVSLTTSVLFLTVLFLFVTCSSSQHNLGGSNCNTYQS